MFDPKTGTVGTTFHRVNRSHPPSCRGCTITKSKWGRDIPMSPIEKIKAREYQERQRWESMKLFAIKQGLVIAQFSPRIYLIVKLNPNGGMWQEFDGRIGKPSNRFFTRMAGEVVHRGDYTSCRRYIEENGEPLPPDLIPQT